MPRFRVNVRSSETGPIFDAAKTKAAGVRAVTAVNEELAQEAKDRVLSRLRNVLRNPTGHYESRIEVQRGERYRGVWDQRVAYGGWLEGVDPRNSGRFKGYRTFRLVQESIRQDRNAIAAPHVQRLARELNGG